MQLLDLESSLTEADRARLVTWLNSAEALLFGRVLKSALLEAEIAAARLTVESDAFSAKVGLAQKAHQARIAIANAIGILQTFRSKPESMALYERVTPKLD